MRTKTLLLTAALGAASLASASAQVYSVNAVGYINLTIPPGFSMIANQLLSGNDTVGSLFAGAPDGTTIFKYEVQANNALGFTVNTLDVNWTFPDQTLKPGEGVFILVPPGAPYNVTLVGNVPIGDLTTAIPAGFSIRSSQVPQSAKVSLDATDPVGTPNLGFPTADGDTIFLFDNAANAGKGGYKVASQDAGWTVDGVPGAPVPKVGESFWISKGTAVPWVRTFLINTP